MSLLNASIEIIEIKRQEYITKNKLLKVVEHPDGFYLCEVKTGKVALMGDGLMGWTLLDPSRPKEEAYATFYPWSKMFWKALTSEIEKLNVYYHQAFFGRQNEDEREYYR